MEPLTVLFKKAWFLESRNGNGYGTDMLLRMHTYIMGYVAAHAYICCYGAVTVVMLLRMHI